jgi:hypothetical protein
MCYSAKAELMSGAHCFLATQSALSCSGTNGSQNITGLSSAAGLAVGMAASGTNVASGAVISEILSATSVQLSAPNTGSVSSISFTGDAFKILLIKSSPSLTYAPTQTNVGTPGTGSPSTSNVGTDEVGTSGTGYTSGGFALTNISPSLPGSPSSTATVSFSVNPSWTSATFSTVAGIIYNTSTRLGAAATPLNGRTISVHDFGGTQQVTAGTFTLLMPTNSGSTAILQIQ